jgi:hypothetical protein
MRDQDHHATDDEEPAQDQAEYPTTSSHALLPQVALQSLPEPAKREPERQLRPAGSHPTVSGRAP